MIEDISQDTHDDIQSRNHQEDAAGSPGVQGVVAPSSIAQDDVTASLGAHESGDDVTRESLTPDEAVASDAVTPAAPEQAEDGKDLRVIKSGRTDATITPTALVSEVAAVQSNLSVEEADEDEGNDADESEKTSSLRKEGNSEREGEKSQMERSELEEDKSAVEQIVQKEEAKKANEETTDSDQAASISEDIQEAGESKSSFNAQLTAIDDHLETEIVKSAALKAVEDTKQEDVDDSEEEEDESTSGGTDTDNVLSAAAPQTTVVVTLPSSEVVTNNPGANAEPEKNPRDEGDGFRSSGSIKSPVSAVSKEASRDTVKPTTLKVELAARFVRSRYTVSSP